MAIRNKVLIGVTSITAIGLVICISRKKRIQKQIVSYQIAEEGYETAHDILYPLKSRQYRRYQASDF